MKVTPRARSRDDRAGDPLDGLVNLFDLGIVLSVAFLLAALSSLDLTEAITGGKTQSTRTRPADSVIAPRDQKVKQIQVQPDEKVVGRGQPIGTVSIASLVSPYRAERDRVRSIHEEAGIPFYEVFVDTPLEECERRDPKGLYAKARAGEIKDLTGVGSPYEEPQNPELTTSADLEEAVRQVLGLLR